MPEIRATASGVVPAPPAAVYGLLADYREGHPSILPPQYFRDLRVEAGGVGAGTRISFEMRALGRGRRVQGAVTEPEPGRRLVETYPGGIETEFLVEPAGQGGSTRVTITTRYVKPGPSGYVERLTVPPFLRRVYRAELRLIAERATGPGPPR